VPVSTRLFKNGKPSNQREKELNLKTTASIIFLALTSGCATNYLPLKVDEKTGFYATSTEVDPGGILAFKTNINPRSFPVILLLTESNNRPNSLEFTTRNALAQAGFKNVYSADELRQFAIDHKFSFQDDQFTRESLRRFSNEITPVLAIDIRYNYIGDARTRTTLLVTDTRSSTNLLVVDHPKLVWSNFDSEALYPVLNQLRKWLASSSKVNA
jgi:hypothetical protein